MRVLAADPLPDGKLALDFLLAVGHNERVTFPAESTELHPELHPELYRSAQEALQADGIGTSDCRLSWQPVAGNGGIVELLSQSGQNRIAVIGYSASGPVLVSRV